MSRGRHRRPQRLPRAVAQALILTGLTVGVAGWLSLLLCVLPVSGFAAHYMPSSPQLFDATVMGGLSLWVLGSLVLAPAPRPRRLPAVT